MTKTANYQLSQYEPGDVIKRADVNQDNAVIDAALAAHDVALTAMPSYTCKRVITSGKVDGDTIFTFDAAPKFVLVFSDYGSCAVLQDGSASLIDSYSGDINYQVTLRLNGTELILDKRTNPGAIIYPTLLTFY